MSTDAETPASRDAPSPTRTSKWRWVAGVAALGVVVAAAVAAYAISRDSGTASQALDSQRIAATQNSCQQWLDDYSTSAGVTPYQGWCNDMGSWMYDQMANGSMIGPVMWGSPQGMIDACRQWAATAPKGDTTATTGPTTTTAWCDRMVGWMSQHMGNWDDWQDWDDHMGDGATG